MNDFVWADYPKMNYPDRGKLKLKMPMSNDYIDEYNQLWQVMYTNSGKCWLYKGIILFEKDIQ